MRKLYLNCESGIAGDMLVAALLDLGGNEENLRKQLASLPLDGYQLKVSRVKKNALDVCDFDVILDEDNHDHDMKYLYGHDHEEHDHEQSHHHHHHDEEYHDDNHHHHRHLSDIVEIVNKSRLTDGAKKITLKIFNIIADAEAKAHGVAKDEVHFHEVGAVDSIVDVCAAAILLDQLNIKDVIVPYLAEGHGTIRCAHGILAIPVPAVSNIITAYQIPIKNLQVEGEMVTPTGAAIVAAIKTEDHLPDFYNIEKIGMGAGKREYPTASILRAMIINTDDTQIEDAILELAFNVDDMTAEEIAFAQEELFAAGAFEVFTVPIGMKKSRPGTLVKVICDQSNRDKLIRTIYANTSTIGVRETRTTRYVLKRKVEKFESRYGTVRIKHSEGYGNHKEKIEYEDLAAIARNEGISLSEARKQLQEDLNNAK